MKVSREQVAEHRRKILAAATRLFNRRGFDAVTVAQVMDAAGLTHGAFYGHFKSKDDLIAQTLAGAISALAVEGDVSWFTAKYLTPGQRDDPAGACPLAGLGAETIRQGPEARAAITTGLRGQIERLSRGSPGANAADRRQAAIGSWSAMVGGMILARIVDDSELSDEVLEQTRLWINRQTARAEKVDTLQGTTSGPRRRPPLNRTEVIA